MKSRQKQAARPLPFPGLPSPPLRSHKSLKTKKTLGVAARKNRQLPNWFRFKNIPHEIRYNAKRRNWRRTKLGI